jgi:hypothetical protein
VITLSSFHSPSFEKFESPILFEKKNRYNIHLESQERRQYTSLVKSAEAKKSNTKYFSISLDEKTQKAYIEICVQFDKLDRTKRNFQGRQKKAEHTKIRAGNCGDMALPKKPTCV